MGSELRRKRAGGRAGHAERAGIKAIDQMPWRIPVNPDRPIEPLGPEGVEAIHKGAMRILEEIGIEFLNEEALTIFREAGLQGRRRERPLGRGFRHGDGGARAPSIHRHAAQPRPRASLSAASTSSSATSPRRPTTGISSVARCSGFMESFRDFIKLTQYFNCIHFAGGYPVEPIDIHPSVRHLDCLYDKLTLTDKVCHAYALGKERVEDVMEMVRIAGGLTPRGVRRHAAHVHQHQLGLAAEARFPDDRRRAAAGAARASRRW